MKSNTSTFISKLKMPKLTHLKRKKFEKLSLFVECMLKKAKGDHFLYDRKVLKCPAVIIARSEVPVFIIRNKLRVLKISPKEFFRNYQKNLKL